MPSLLKEGGLNFGSDWPQGLKLPALPQQQKDKRQAKKQWQKRSGVPRCVHKDAPILARGLCKKCYHDIYNKVSRKLKSAN